MRSPITALLLIILLSYSCSVENLETESHLPKENFSSFNYVLATEDASDVDITTFFAFNMSDISMTDKNFDLFNNNLFINSNPSVSSGHHSMGKFFFSMAKDKKQMSSTPGLYRLSLDKNNRVYIDYEIGIPKDNLFPARKLKIVNDTLGYYYNESKGAQKIQIFNPTLMLVTGEIELEAAIRKFRPEAKWRDESGNNMIRTGSLVIEHKEDKLYVSVVFLEKVGFNLISNDENNFYLAVIDTKTNQFEKFIAYEGAQTVAFFVSENNSTAKDEEGNLYFCSWGWNQFNKHRPSKIFRIKAGESDFDTEWIIDIEKLFGKDKIAQSIAAYKNKIYLHVSNQSYKFASSADQSTLDKISMSYYAFDTKNPQSAIKLDIPSSNISSRNNVFSIIDDKLYICVPNHEQNKFNGVYSIGADGVAIKDFSILNKYRPTRIYKLSDKK